VRCKYVYKYGEKKNEQCKKEAETGSHYCFWHKQMKEKNLNGKVINEEDLREAYLVEADLMGTKLKKGVKLWHANLQRASLHEANLQETSLLGANLQRANLFKANLQGTTLSEANLQETILFMANLQRAVLQGTNLQGAELLMANLQETYLSGANLQGASLIAANLQGADLLGANLQGTILYMANFQNANLLYSKLKGTSLFGVFIKDCKNLRYAEFEEEAIEEMIGELLLKKGSANLDSNRLLKELTEDIINSLCRNREIDKEDKNILKNSINKFINRLGTNIPQIFSEAQDVYLNLKNHFREDGSYDLSGKFYIRELAVKGKINRVNYLIASRSLGSHFIILVHKLNPFKKKEKEEKKEERISLLMKELIKNFLAWIGNKVLNLTSLYGESSMRVIFTAILIILFYSTVYFISGGVVVSNNLQVVNGFWHYLYFSILTFVTFSCGELQPLPSMRPWVSSEAFLGTFLLAYFVVVVSRKIMR